jgi:hypothetical protein
MAEDNISWAPKGPDGYRFIYPNEDGKVTCDVSVPRSRGAPDMRSPDEKLKAAQEKVRSLARRFAEEVKSPRSRRGTFTNNDRSVDFTYTTEDGESEVTARVSVAESRGAPERSADEKLKAARSKVQRLASAWVDAATAGRFASPSARPAG